MRLALRPALRSPVPDPLLALLSLVLLLSGGGCQEAARSPVASRPRDLLDTDPARPVRVCAADYLAKDLPGIDAEIRASIAVWGVYIGRPKASTVRFAPLPRMKNTPSHEVARTYAHACGEDADVVVGYAPLTKERLGETGITEGGVRWVFFRDMREVQFAPRSLPYTWMSVAEADGRRRSPEEILERILARNTAQYHRGNTLSTLPLLMHEMGHAWGLCDAYKAPDSWCFPVGNLRTETEQSIMDADAARQQMFLSDEDIDAIQGHATGAGLSKTAFRGGAPVRLPPLPVCALDRVDRNGKEMEVRGGWVALRPATMTILVRPEGAREKGASVYTTHEARGEHLAETLRIPAPAGKAEVTLVVRLDDDPSQTCQSTVVLTP